MTHAFITIAIPFTDTMTQDVERELDTFGNPPRRCKYHCAEDEDETNLNRYDVRRPAGSCIRCALRNRGIHFMSMTVVRGDRDHEAFLVLEASVDGTSENARNIIAAQLAPQLVAVLNVASHNVNANDLDAFLKRHSHNIDLGLTGTPGLCFSGTPGMSVDRIKREYALARFVRDTIATQKIVGTPLHVLKAVRARVAAEKEFAPLLEPQSAELLLSAPAGNPFSTIIRLVFGGLWAFFWPYFVTAGLVILGLTLWTYWVSGKLAALGVLSLTTALAFFGILATVIFLFARLRAQEKTDEPDDTTPDRAMLAEVMVRENDGDQNHLAGVSIMKPGRLRNFTLRLAYWVIAQLAAAQFRPGYLGDIGTIHFARWILLPGTNKLLFFSNYGGSWESYLEDFITKASAGLTGVWSNTYGFPRTSNLFSDGAKDGDRFKRWARRQQRPTHFWYSAYPNMTTARVRTSAAIRHGLASSSTEDEAADWLSQLGSRVRSADVIQSPQIQKIMFGGMANLPDAACVLLRLPDKPSGARAWLTEILPKVSFGSERPEGSARILSFSASGLRRLGLKEERLQDFPIAFLQGMSDAHRANKVLFDTGDDKPDLWWWGHKRNPPDGTSNRDTPDDERKYEDKSVDAALLVYVEASPGQVALKKECDDLAELIARKGGAEIHRIVLKTLAEPAIEAFGFVDGVSQPIIRGSRRWLSDRDSIHVVEPGEFILGYPDNYGYFPVTPTIPAIEDPENILSVAGSAKLYKRYPSFERTSANRLHDLGANGSFLVIRQLEQDVEAFNEFTQKAAEEVSHQKGVPPELDLHQLKEWVAAKMVGRWRDGTSLVRYPNRPGSGWGNKPTRKPDNDFLLGKEDPAGHRCPFGAHIRRANPRESLELFSESQLSITNRHRILRMGRQYDPQKQSGADSRPGLLFMCLNADIERQFEFIQQTWIMTRLFHGLDGEVDSILGRGSKGGRLTIPSSAGPITIKGMKDFVTMRGGGYFFMPGRSALHYLATLQQ